MTSIVTHDFRMLLRRLPAAIQRQAKKSYRLWQEDPRHPSLQFKCVNPDEGIYSVRITLNYRALAVVDAGSITWFWIGTHAEYDQLLRQG